MSLADKMVAFEKARSEADLLEAEIKAEVMALGKTQKVGRVTASYSSGRGVYDYEDMANHLGPDEAIVANLTTIKTVVDWRSVCEQSGATDEIKAKFYTPGQPSVSVKLAAD